MYTSFCKSTWRCFLRSKTIAGGRSKLFHLLRPQLLTMERPCADGFCIGSDAKGRSMLLGLVWKEGNKCVLAMWFCGLTCYVFFIPSLLEIILEDLRFQWYSFR